MQNNTRIVSWLLQLIAWDGILPAAVWTIPFLFTLAFPNNRGLIEITAIVVPISALLIRFHVGRTRIRTNYCGEWMRRLQTMALCVGILAFLLIDAFIVLSHLVPEQAEETTKFAAMFYLGFYIPLMAIALYPGTEPWEEIETD